MLGEWAIFGIFAGAAATLQLSFSFIFLRKFDKNADGEIQVDEVPSFMKITQDMDVNMEKPGYAELSILNLWRCFVEAMLHSFCYGCLTVFSLNYMIDFIMLRDRRYAYLVACLMIHMTCMFMCKFATNGIHVSTSHVIHFFYYGFGYIPLVFFSRRPEREYMVVIAALFLLAIYIVGRYISMPSYPGIQQVCRLYEYQLSDISVDDNHGGVWKLKSTPSVRFWDGEDTSPDEESWKVYPKEISELPSYRQFAKWAFTCPVYEIMNTHISSSFTIGVLSGTVTSLLVGHSGLFNAGVVSNESLGFSVLIAALVVLVIQGNGLYGRVENEMHSRTLGKFRPKTVAFSVAIMGAAAVVIHLEPISDDHPVITYWVGFGVLAVNLLLTFVLSVWAKLRHRDFHAQEEERAEA